MRDAEDPFDQLLRSHRRLEERLEGLTLAAADLDTPKSAEAREYITETLAWIERAVRRHEEDEERSLFPRLAHLPELAAPIATLSGEHRHHEQLAAALGPALADPAAARAIVSQLRDAYRAHIELEERTLFPAARAALDAAGRAALSAEMNARRGR